MSKICIGLQRNTKGKPIAQKWTVDEDLSMHGRTCSIIGVSEHHQIYFLLERKWERICDDGLPKPEDMYLQLGTRCWLSTVEETHSSPWTQANNPTSTNEVELLPTRLCNWVLSTWVSYCLKIVSEAIDKRTIQSIALLLPVNNQPGVLEFPHSHHP